MEVQRLGFREPSPLGTTAPTRCSMYVNNLFQFCAVAIHSISDRFPCRLQKLCAGIRCNGTKEGETVHREEKNYVGENKYSHQVHDNTATLTGICFCFKLLFGDCGGYIR